MAQDTGREIATTQLLAGRIQVGETITFSTVLHDDNRRRQYTGRVFFIGKSEHLQHVRDVAKVTVDGFQAPISIPLEPLPE